MNRTFPWLPVAAVLMLLALLSGCGRGPAPADLQQELQNRLDTSFQQDLFGIGSFKRTGSAPFRDLEKSESGIYIYYDAELDFLEDYSLTQWRGLNLGTLAFAIGATEAGISGFRARGNQRGDRLLVHGRLAFGDGDAGWVPLRQTHDPKRVGAGDSRRDMSSRSVEAVLADTRGLLAGDYAKKGNPSRELIVQELAHAVGRIDLGLARLEGRITLGTGPVAGTYHEFGRALAQVAGQRAVPMFSAESAGSVENASRLQAGRLDFGLVQSDVAQLVYEGWQNGSVFPYRDLRAVASLWPEAMHLVTLRESGVRELGDLARRRVAIGRRGSGSRVNAILLALAAELSPGQAPDVREIDLQSAIAQLEAGEIEALFLTAAVPAPAIQALASRRDDVHFLQVPGSLLRNLDDRHYAYYPLTVAARTYPGQTEPFTTLGLTAALMTRVQVTDERVEQVLELLLSGGDELAKRYYRGAFISRETMRLGLAVPLHPAAERFYQRYDQAVKTAPR